MFTKSGKFVGPGKVGEAGCTGPTESKLKGRRCGRHFYICWKVC